MHATGNSSVRSSWKQQNKFFLNCAMFGVSVGDGEEGGREYNLWIIHKKESRMYDMIIILILASFD